MQSQNLYYANLLYFLSLIIVGAVYLHIDSYLQKKIQDMCCRFIFDKKRSDHCGYQVMRNQLGWLSMNQRGEIHCMTMMYKILHGLAPNYLQSPYLQSDKLG